MLPAGDATRTTESPPLKDPGLLPNVKLSDACAWPALTRANTTKAL
jgi:hypothetical protein